MLGRLPYAVAGARAQVDDARCSPQTRRGALHFTVYQLLRSATLPLIGQYLLGPAPLASTDKAPRSLTTALAGLRSPCFGDWVALAETLVKHGPALGLDAQPGFAPAMAASKQRAVEVPQEYADTRSSSRRPHGLLAAFQWLRNGCAHAGLANDAACRAAVEVYRPWLDELLGDFAYLAEDEVLVLRGGIDETEPQVQRMRGPSAPPAEPWRLDDALREAFAETPVVLRTSAGRILPLFPLLHGHLRGEPLGVYDGHYLREDPKLRRRTIYYLGLGARFPVDDDESPPEDHADAGERLAALLVARGVRLELKRDDVKPWTLAETANDFSRRTFLDQLGTRYLPPCWLERPAVMGPLRRFVGDASGGTRARAFLLAGAAGSGKSATLCRLAAEELGLVEAGSATGAIVIFVRGDGIDSGQEGPTLFPDLAHKLGLEVKDFKGGFSELFRHLARARGQDREVPDRRVVVLLDALNEARRHGNVMSEALDLVRAAREHPFVRIVLSVREEYLEVWRGRRFEHEASPFANLEGLFVLPPDDPTRPRRPEDPPAWRLPPLGPAEAKAVYESYQMAASAGADAGHGAGRVKATWTPWSRLPESDRRLLTNPLHLHLWMETFDGREARPQGSASALFATYLDALFARRDRLWDALQRIVDRWLEQGRTDLDDADANELRTTWAAGLPPEERRTRLDPIELASVEGLLVKRVTEEGGGYRVPVQFLRERLLHRRLTERGAGASREALASWAERATFPDLVGALALVAEDVWQADRSADLAALEASAGGLKALARAMIARALAGEPLDACSRRATALVEAGGEDVTWVLFLLVDGELDGVSPHAVRRRLLEPALAQLERLATAEPGRTDLALDLAVSLAIFGDLLRDEGDGSRGRVHYQRSREILEREVTAQPGRTDLAQCLSCTLHRLGGLALDEGDGAHARQLYERSHEIAEQLAAAEPVRADRARDLSLSLSRLGDLAWNEGDGARARRLYERSCEIAEQLAAAEPMRADRARDLSVSLSRLGDLARDEGNGERARPFYEHTLRIAERLAMAEPGRVDRTRDLAIALERLGDLAREVGDGASAEDAFARALGIRERLATAEPGLVYLSADLSLSLARGGDLAWAHGDGGRARELYERSHEIAERLAAAEPGRADLALRLSQSFSRLGYLARQDGDMARAGRHLQRSLEIRESLAEAEPGRVDLAWELSVSLGEMGDLAKDEGRGAQARVLLERSREILESLVAAVPRRSNLQRDLSLVLRRLGLLAQDRDDWVCARELLTRSHEITERLAAVEPGRVDLGRDLSESLEKLGTLAFESGDRARARELFKQAHRVTERLAAAEPGRVDLAYDLAVSHRLLHLVSTTAEESRGHLKRVLEILETHPALKPRADARILREAAEKALNRLR